VSRASPFIIALSTEDAAELEVRVRRHRSEQRAALRARIVLMAAAGTPNAVIAQTVGVVPNTVLKWRKRFCQEGLAGLVDRPRAGRPPVFGPEVRALVKAIACEPPTERDVPLSRYALSDIAAQAIAEGATASISASTVGRWLARDALRPWRYRSWIFPRDPRFAEKAGVVLDLYQRRYRGRRLRADEFVLSADEKTSIQARCRCHPTLPPDARRAMRVEHEYARKGALAYLAAWDVHRGVLTGRTEPTTGIAPFRRLVDAVMSSEPYASARRVFWIVDNGSSHRGEASAIRLQRQWPTLRLVHLPVHASWLNQIEIVFSIVQRKVLTPNDLTDLAELARRLRAFEARFNATARPFDWRFGRAELDALLSRLERHVPAAAA
jgi:transposase-like protein